MSTEKAKQDILALRTALGIEFGSTRIKAVLIGEDSAPIASGDYEWENQLIDGIWTYSMEDIHKGLQTAYASLKADVKAKYDVTLTEVGAIGISGMMHGYIVFDENENLLVPFRTWRNTITQQAAEELTALFNFNIPQRWSIAHLYQAILNGEDHVGRIQSLYTLAAYIQYRLSGLKVAGIGEASGMFPIDAATKDYDQKMVDKFDKLIAPKGFSWKLRDILPKVLVAGEQAGVLTEEGAKLLDPEGDLKAGIPLAPPEGDAGTGMAATNSVGVRTCNVSAGTSDFAMIVLEKDLAKVHPELDIVTTPSGDNVAMVHCNNCTSDLNAWVRLFKEFADLIGADVDMNTVYGKLYTNALNAEPDGGGLLAFNYYSGEPVTGFAEGRPLFVRENNARMTLANFMRTHLYASLAALKAGLDILRKEEEVKVDRTVGHGGLFKTKGVGQRMLAAAMDAPVTVMETAGEGGPWGMALLAAYMIRKEEGETLEAYLDNKVFAGKAGETVAPVPEDIAGFDAYMERYKAGYVIEHAAIGALK